MNPLKNVRPLCLTALLLATSLMLSLWQGCGTDGPDSETPAKETTGQDGSIQEATPSDNGQNQETGRTDTTSPDAAPDAGPADTKPADRATPEPTVDAGPTPTKTEFGGSRPATLKVPPTYDHSKPHPLVVLLHGYGATGSVQSFYFGIQQLVDNEGVLVIAPEGTKDPTGKQFWNATPACCDFAKSGVDDVAYLLGLVKEIQGVYNVDKNKIYFIGHSNGGFMSHRMACEASDVIAGIVSLAGATYADDTSCKPSNKISILQIHGKQDATIKYAGGANVGNAYPSAENTVAAWAKLNGCTGQLKDTGKKDLDSKAAGDETTIASYEGCPTGIATGLWSMEGVGHVPAFSANYIGEVWAWMKAHPKQP